MALTSATVKPKSSFNGDKCRHCLKAVKVGQQVLWARTENYTVPRFVVHVSCLTKILSGIGIVDHEKVAIEEQVQEIRERIRATGDIFA